MSRKARKREGPGLLSAAGLVRFYEESDVGVKLKPHVLIGVMVAFTIAVIALSKLAPLA
ncbi:MAG: preprotein translocase subunit Sec61beta [Thermosphaera sp.]